MTVLAWLVVVVCALLLLQVSRRWAHFPFLACALYTSTDQTVTGMRLVILAGIVRVILKGERLAGGVNIVDRLMFAWAGWAIVCAAFHEPFGAILTLRCGLVYNCLGTYILMRIFIVRSNDFLLVARSLLILLVPVAAEMIVEKLGSYNWFALMGNPWDHPDIRNGRVRAQGPFQHAILAGTAGAVSLPLAVLFWKQNRKFAYLGLATTMCIVFASASSGPILTTAAVIGVLSLWNFRQYMRAVRWIGLLGLIGLAAVMNSPVYYLISYVDLAGGSTGWHRAALIDAALHFLNEWWLTGTDHTRHWMPTGIPANENHSDITNVYLIMGVYGGLPLMLLFIAILTVALAKVTRMTKSKAKGLASPEFQMWSLGAILFGHAVTFFSVDYFDQTVVFYYLALASVSSLAATMSQSTLRAFGRSHELMENLPRERLAERFGKQWGHVLSTGITIAPRGK